MRSQETEDTVGCMHIVWSVIVGFVVGLIARAVMPGAQSMGFFMTSIIGIVGSFVGAFIGSLISKPVPGSKFHPAGFFMSIVGALVVLGAWRLLAR
jgi:uncharacterized membrane protein YeaQ/YmgE (transglycosylase-associated protein family)